MGDEAVVHHGLLVAYDHDCTLSFTPLICGSAYHDNAGDSSRLHSCDVARHGCDGDTLRGGGDAVHLTLSSPAVALTRCASDAVLVLQRNGALVRVRLVSRTGSSTCLEEEQVMGGGTVESERTGDRVGAGWLSSASLRASLQSADLFASWQHEAVDPRTRRANADAESGDDGDE